MPNRERSNAAPLALRRIRVLDEILRNLYHDPDHGNKPDPVDELIYIVLSQRTREAAYQAAYVALKRRYHSWRILLSAPLAELENILRPSGMSWMKAKTLKAIVAKLNERFGRVTLDPARKWSNEKLFAFLTSLPRVSTKTALCVMMYSMKRTVFPADSNTIRVCNRLGLTGFDTAHHKQAQAQLGSMFPEDLRYSLHVNLVAHGRYICKPVPKCDRCEIRKFCDYYRRRERRRNGGRRVFSIADVFSGAGGMTNGFVRAGFRVALAVDCDPNAVDTYEANHSNVHPDRIVRGDIRHVPTSKFRAVTTSHPIDVVIGGPPCQGFSLAGARTRTNINGCRFRDDPRNELYREFLRVVSALEPVFFVMENVPGILSAKDGLYVRQILEDFANLDPGYTVQVITLQASEYGVPQNRRRVFFVGTTHGPDAERRLDAVKTRLELAKTISGKPLPLWSAIEDLPPVAAAEGAEVIRATPPRGRRSRYRSVGCNGSRFVFN